MNTYMKVRPPTNMKKGCLYRTSCDEKNREIAPMMMMIQNCWWSRSSDDPYVMMINTWWWSRWSDDPYLMMIQWWSSNDDPVVVMIQILWWRRLQEENDLKTMMTRRQRRLEYEDNLKMKMMRWSSRYKEEVQCWKLCWKNTFLVKREWENRWKDGCKTKY